MSRVRELWPTQIDPCGGGHRAATSAPAFKPQPVLAAARTASLSDDTPAPAAMPASQRALTRASSSAVGSSARRASAIT